MFQGRLPSIAIDALRALFQLDCDLSTAIEDARVAHGVIWTAKDTQMVVVSAVVKFPDRSLVFCEMCVEMLLAVPTSSLLLVMFPLLYQPAVCLPCWATVGVVKCR